MHVSVKSPLKELSEVASSLVVNMVGVEIGTTPCLEYPDFERIVEVNPVSSLLPTSKNRFSTGNKNSHCIDHIFCYFTRILSKTSFLHANVDQDRI